MDDINDHMSGLAMEYEDYLYDCRDESANRAINNKIWTTKDGYKIHFSNMDENHLRNTIRFLERKSIFQKEKQEIIIKLLKEELNDRVYFKQ